MQNAHYHVPLILLSILFSLTPVKIYNKITSGANVLLALPANVLFLTENVGKFFCVFWFLFLV